MVDPLQLTRMAHGRLLDHFGCMTHFAENASQAAAACANMEFDVILMGVLLPDIDGYQLARHIRKHGGPVNSRAYIAAVTMLEQPELLEQCLKSGMNETIRKPADMASLRGMFRRMRASQRERKKEMAMTLHDARLSGSASSTTSRGSRFTETEVAVNPYSISGAPKPRARPTRVKSKRDTLRSGLSLRNSPRSRSRARGVPTRAKTRSASPPAFPDSRTC